MLAGHPTLRKLADAARAQPGLADISIAAAREQMAARTAARPPGPAIHEVRDLVVPGSECNIPLRLYRPRDPIGVAVVFHGGGWLMGSLESFDATSRHLAHESGLAVVSVDYRLAPESPFPAALDDAWTATQWVAKNSELLEVDSRRLVVLGESAGGNLAAGVCLLARDFGAPAVCAQILIYPPVDARLRIASLDQFAEGYLQTKRDVIYAYRTYGLDTLVDATDRRLSPLLAPSHRGLPMTLLISAGCDAIRDDTNAYATCLLAADVSATHVCYSSMMHTFFGMRGIVADAAIAQKQVAVTVREAVLLSDRRSIRGPSTIFTESSSSGA